MTTPSPGNPPESICLLRLSAIGDVTHLLPVIATLQHNWPATNITWIIGKLEYQLVKSLSNIDFIIFDKSKGRAEYLSLRKKLIGKKFDFLLMMQVALRANLISLLINADHKIGYDRLRSRDFHRLFCHQHIDGPHRVHVLDTFFQFIEKIGIQDRHMDWLVEADGDSKNFAQEIVDAKPTWVINPCSSVRKNNWRNWPESYYATIIDYLTEAHGVQVVLTGGPSAQEKEISQRISDLCSQQPVNLVGETDLSQLLALLEQAQCLIAPDTGPAHMATVAGTPVIGLFASSNPLRSGPYNSLDLCVNAYPEALQLYQQKQVDEVRWGARVRHQDVMQLVTIERVKQRIDGLLSTIHQTG